MRNVQAAGQLALSQAELLAMECNVPAGSHIVNHGSASFQSGVSGRCRLSIADAKEKSNRMMVAPDSMRRMQPAVAGGKEMNREFWKMLDDMAASSEIVIDRPKGSRHPRYPQVVYELDYGYLQGTGSMDGGGIDVWLGSMEDRRIGAVMCTVDMLKKDSEIKLLIGCTEEETEIVRRFHNDSEYMKGLLIRRDDYRE